MLPPFLSAATLDALVARALSEDLGERLGSGGASLCSDVTTAATVAPGRQATARVQAKEAGTAAGLAVAERVFHAVDETVTVTWHAGDGAPVEAGEPLGRLEGKARALLVGERLALNFVQRMSGIATATRRMVDAAAPHGAQILDTRKTAPGLRALDKWAVRLGGGQNHRLGLYDLILIKDNHLAAAGGVRPALEAAHRYCDEREGDLDIDLDIELETRTLGEVRAALTAADEGHSPDIVLLDNMARRAKNGATDVGPLRDAVSLIDGRFRTEASGNVTPQTVAAIAQTGVDFISSGALTHSVRALDVSMVWEDEKVSG